LPRLRALASYSATLDGNGCSQPVWTLENKTAVLTEPRADLEQAVIRGEPRSYNVRIGPEAK
jgi:hypothetical protein